jgi:hypothetical protein
MGIGGRIPPLLAAFAPLLSFRQEGNKNMECNGQQAQQDQQARR